MRLSARKHQPEPWSKRNISTCTTVLAMLFPARRFTFTFHFFVICLSQRIYSTWMMRGGVGNKSLNFHGRNWMGWDYRGYSVARILGVCESLLALFSSFFSLLYCVGSQDRVGFLFPRSFASSPSFCLQAFGIFSFFHGVRVCGDSWFCLAWSRALLSSFLFFAGVPVRYVKCLLYRWTSQVCKLGMFL